MLTLTIKIKESEPGRLMMFFDRLAESTTELEELASKVYHQEVEKAWRKIQDTGEGVVEVEGEHARKLAGKIFT